MSKTIIVTGAATTYGRAIIQTLADEGHGVVAIMDPLRDTNSAAEKELRQIANVELIEVDLKNDLSVKSGFSFILNRYGHVDILINNEPPVKPGFAETTTIETYHELFDANVYGALRAFKALLPTMKKNRGGLLINVNSGVSYFAAPFIAVVSMAKAGLEIITDGILAEVRRFGIESVCLCTGYYPAEFLVDSSRSEDAPEIDLLQSAAELNRIEAGILGKNKQGRQHAQAVAALVLELVNMPRNTRPGRCSLNPNFTEAERHFAEAKKLAEEAWGISYEN